MTKDGLQLLMQKAQAQASSNKRARKAAAPATPSAAAERAPCPLCGDAVLASLLPAHVEFCLQRQEQRQQQPQPPKPMAVPAPTPVPLTVPPPAPAATCGQTQQNQSTSTASASNAADAFALLMQAAKTLQKQQHVFYQERIAPSGHGQAPTWRWHWWQKGVGSPPAGLPPACWTATMQVKETVVPPGRQPPSAPSNSAPGTSLAATLQSPTSTQQQQQQQQQLDEATDTAPATQQVQGEEDADSQEAVQQLRLGGGGGAGGGEGRQRGGGVAVQVTLHLCTNVPPGDGGPVDWTTPGLRSTQSVPPEGRWKGLPSGLKSALQKCVRLGRAAPAVRIALQMLKSDPGELLRRLPIICLEDALLHPNLPLITWLMAAHAKGYTLGAVHVAEVLRFVCELATSRVRDFLPRPMVIPGSGLGSMHEVDALLSAHGHCTEAALVKSLMLRAHMGGMHGDVAMMSDYARLWMARFRGAAGAPPSSASLRHLQQLQHAVGQVPVSPLTVVGISSSQAPSSPPMLTGIAASSAAPFAAVSSLLAAQQQPWCSPPPPQALQQVLLVPPQQQQQQHLQQHEQEGGSDLDCSSWAAFITTVHQVAEGPAPPALWRDVLEVGPLRRGDVPLSAIDFHVSELLEHLLALAPVQQAMAELTENCWGTSADAADNLRSTIWLFRSSTNARAWMQHLYHLPASGTQPPAAAAVTRHAAQGAVASASGAAPLQQEDALEDVPQPLEVQVWRLAKCARGMLPSDEAPLTAEQYALEVALETEDAKKSRLLRLWQVIQPLCNAFAAQVVKQRFQRV